MTTSEENKIDDAFSSIIAPIPVDREWISKLLKRFPNPNSRCHDKALVVAPMVDQSDLPFRLLCRKYGSNLCFTPMIHSGLVIRSDAYRKKFTGTWLDPVDRPLIAQLCGSDPDTMLEAAQLVEPYVDGIDINCGCPQGIAKRGDYGAYLLEQEEKLLKLVKHLVKHLKVPLSVKVRLLPDPEINPYKIKRPEDDEFDIPAASLALYGKLVDAGVHLLTIHGRTRKQKQDLTGKADWDTIAKAVKLYGHRIPIFANGSIDSYEDVEECLKITNVDGVMSSEALLEYPPIFYKIPQTPKRTIGRVQLANEYLEFAQQYPPNVGGQGSGIKCIRMHMHRFLHKDLQDDIEFRKKIITDKTIPDLAECIEICRQKHIRENHLIEDEKLSWYTRHRDGRETVAKLQEQRRQQLENGDCKEEDDDDDDVDSIQECGNFFTANNEEEGGDY
jgi:tRNA-dihydrouridine synthase 1